MDQPSLAATPLLSRQAGGQKMKVQIGADWDKDKCVVAWRHRGKLLHDKVMRTPESVNTFVDKVTRLVGGDDEVAIEVAIEAGDRYWVALWFAADADVLVFDGKKTRRFTESLYSSDASDDRRSAETLLAMLGSPAHRAAANVQWPVEIRHLMLTLNARKRAAQDSNVASNRLWALLREYRPSLEATGKHLRAQWLLNALYAAPTAAAWNALTDVERKALLAGSQADRRPGLAAAFAKDVIAVAECMESTVQMEIRHAVIALKHAQAFERDSEAELKAALDASEKFEHAGEMNGIGTVIRGALAISFGIADEQAKLAGVPNRDAAAMLMGAAPVTRRSGVMGDAAPRASRRRAGNKVLHTVPYILGLQLSTRHPWAKAAYAHYRARGKTAAAAFRCITRSFLRVARAMERDGLAFDEERYITALKSKGVEWAMAL